VEKAAVMYILQGVSKTWGVEGEPLGLLGAASGLGQAVGSCIFGRWSDTYGRRSALVWALVTTFVPGVWCAWAQSYATFLALRFATNVALGGALPVAFTLVAEFLPPAERPRWSPLLYATYGLGRLVTAGLAWALVRHSWRLYLLALALPCGVLVLLKGLIPESPYFLVAQERHEEARRTLEEAASANGMEPPLGPRMQLLGEEAPIGAGGWATVLQSGPARLLCVMWFIMALGSEWSNWALKMMRQDGVPSSVAYGGLMFLNSNELVVPLVLALLQQSALKKGSILVLASSCGLALFSVLVVAGVVATDVGPCQFVVASVVASYFGIAVWVLHYSVTPGYFAAEVRGTGFGACMAFNRVGFVTGPLAAAGIVQSSQVTLFLACAACYLILVVLALFLRCHGEGRHEEGAAANLVNGGRREEGDAMNRAEAL